MATKKSRKPSKPLTQIIEEELAKPIVVSINEVRIKTTVYGAIVLQLLQKTLMGNRRARNMLFRYHDFAVSLNRNTQNFRVRYVNRDTGKEMKHGV